MTRTIRGSALSAVLLIGCGTEVDLRAPASSSCAQVYAPAASSWPLPMLPHPSGMALADVDGDGFIDAIVASGNDVDEGPAAVIFNPLSQREPWLSETKEHYLRIATADINQDGTLDVVATIYPPGVNVDSTLTSTIVAHVFISTAGGLPTQPTQMIYIEGNVAGSDAGFADINGDGWLDLAISTMDLKMRKPTPQQVYLNRAGMLDLENPWQAQTAVAVATALSFADLNADGLVDLILASPTPAWSTTFFGALDATGLPMLETEGQSANFGKDEVFPVNIQWLVDEHGSAQVLGVFNNQLCGSPNCPASVARFDSTLSTPSWSTDDSEMWTAGKAADLDGDGDLDLVAGYWKGPATNPQSGPLLAFCSDGTSWSQTGVPLSQPSTFFSFDMGMADLDNGGLSEHQFTWTGQPSGSKTAILTLPETIVQRLVQVERNGRVLGTGEFSWVPANPWVGFTPPLEPSDRVEIDYATTSSPDIVLTDFSKPDSLVVLPHQ